MNNKILIIEDDVAISDMVKNYLIKEGFSVTTAFDGEEGVVKFLNDDFDLIILDLMLPKLDGLDTMKIIRNKSSVPILIMSAKGSDVEKAVGLELGADDYIAKPFSMIEISARIKAAIRRATKYSSNKEENIVKIKDITVDLDSFLVSKNGQNIQLTSKEFDILKLFVKNPNRVFTKAQIYSFAWKEEYYGDENVINVHMRRLREKIEDDPSKPEYIKTLWGIGYKLEVN
ncbi:response regulator transcription factor [Clostridium intestinale]|uniref:Stage 0 sporulation protein A homolog n=2 Tax=Clostridium intestinale TaxID=36845 RepID=U2NQ42_9CLOT|nr:response regulator transcription factor [Clostridium intestinale]ERK30976.1 two-component response regulator ycbL [Clostridium intestinale URNW]QLY78126.1 response regulator transcription factor [Clostridium intestinale]